MPPSEYNAKTTQRDTFLDNNPYTEDTATLIEEDDSDKEAGEDNYAGPLPQKKQEEDKVQKQPPSSYQQKPGHHHQEKALAAELCRLP